METLAAIAIVLIAIPVALVAARYRALLAALGLGAFAVALGGFALLLFGPKDLLVRHPALINVLHPYRVGLWIGLAVVVGSGVLLGVLVRMAYQQLCRGRSRP